MKRKVPLILSMMLITAFCEAQDRDIIIRNNGDTIRCTITRVDSNAVYCKVKLHDNYVATVVKRNDIRDFIMRVPPDNPVRIMCEKKITRNSFLAVTGAAGFIAGGALVISGYSDLHNSGNKESSTEKGLKKTFTGIPIMVTGAVLGSIGLKNRYRYKRRLQELYSVSVSIDCDSFYKGFTISYKF
jgi:hypothetical protein